MTQTQQEYKKWLQWFINNGGKPTHYYDYPFARHTFILASQGGRYLGGHGSNRIKLIVPKHVTNFTVDDIGHSCIYQYDMDKMKNTHFIPQYADLCFDYEARGKELKEDMEWEAKMRECKREYKRKYEREYEERQQLLKKYDNFKCETYIEKERKEQERQERLQERRAEYEDKARMNEYNNKKANEGWLQLIGIGLFFLILIGYVSSLH